MCSLRPIELSQILVLVTRKTLRRAFYVEFFFFFLALFFHYRTQASNMFKSSWFNMNEIFDLDLMA